MRTQYQIDSNLGTWTVYADDTTIIGRHDSGDDVRLQLHNLGVDVETDEVLLVDADGNGSCCWVPAAWIGDGEPLVLSQRVLDRIDAGLVE